jgi:hypothetical protein
MCHDWGTEKGVPSIGVSGMRKWFTNRQLSNDAKGFQSPSVIMCHRSIGVVAYVGISALLKVRLLSVPKRTSLILLASDENLKCVGNHT